MSRRCLDQGPDGRPAAKKSKPSTEWRSRDDSVYWRDYGSTGSDKVFGLDLDDTLIAPKSGNTFPMDTNDWKLLHADACKRVLKQHLRNGFKFIEVRGQ
ncbi:unnamed protein product [Vitrella brassicaformis CCMP3155]|uniref:Uncharacterized protein n=2 Tax=Vitrella brassicaformis TaxID=1169539 RepID=A0A0G4EEE2_VITBC|nr:unnamed protein product [Vitrella brassicaformis CCMP3155]|eukprot:CEL94363.1 unnamed protein product [Vitrella brassicaformis CCMP3155]